MRFVERIVNALWRWRVRKACCPIELCRLPLKRVEVTTQDGWPVEFKGECPEHGWMVASSRARP